MYFVQFFIALACLKLCFCTAESQHPNCERFCTKEWAPVCATDGCETLKTFSNQCLMDIENCKSNGRWRRVFNVIKPCFPETETYPPPPPTFYDDYSDYSDYSDFGYPPI